MWHGTQKHDQPPDLPSLTLTFLEHSHTHMAASTSWLDLGMCDSPGALTQTLPVWPMARALRHLVAGTDACLFCLCMVFLHDLLAQQLRVTFAGVKRESGGSYMPV